MGILKQKSPPLAADKKLGGLSPAEMLKAQQAAAAAGDAAAASNNWLAEPRLSDGTKSSGGSHYRDGQCVSYLLTTKQ